MDITNKFSNYYISYNKIKKEVFSKTNLKLKYNYCDINVLEKVHNVTSINIPKQYTNTERKVNSSFIDYLSIIIAEMDNEKILEYFEKVLEISRFNYSEIDMDESMSRIISKNNELLFDVVLPKRKENTDLLSAATIHELSHFSLFLSKDKKDVYEYSEVLPFFFEYMMYSAIHKEKGKNKFISNRMKMIEDNINDLETDLFYAMHPNYLGINPENYEYSIASALTYIESFEYVLQLINLKEKDKDIIYDEIGKMLIGESTLERSAKKMDINIDDYKNIYKLCR